jgi:hypothetical protein
MALTRHSFTSTRKDSNGKDIVGISQSCYKIYYAVESGTINYGVHVLEQGERLDYLAGINYGDSSLWWVIAAASGIGYALQVPPGTIIRIPNSLSQVFEVLI